MFCTRCGQQNPAEARFCARCGTTLLPVEGGRTDQGEHTTTIDMTGEGGVPSADDLDAELRDAGLPGASRDPAGGIADAHADQHAEGQAEAAALPVGAALLVVLRGPNAGSRFVLDAEKTTAGRNPKSDIFLDDVTVSRQHAEFHRIETGFLVCDTGSLNGTYLNRDRIERAELTGGDEVQIGRFRLVYLAGPRPRGEGKGT